MDKKFLFVCEFITQTAKGSLIKSIYLYVFFFNSIIFSNHLSYSSSLLNYSALHIYVQVMENICTVYCVLYITLKHKINEITSPRLQEFINNKHYIFVFLRMQIVYSKNIFFYGMTFSELK